jgi:drug/metabolite transporter (DMT)-like permease
MSLESLDPALLFLGFVTGGIGFVLFVYGKKQQRMPQLFTGVLFMVYPYFVTSVSLMIGIGVALGVALWWIIRAGY